MTTDYFKIDIPEYLEDEVLLIETAGEMPEVALAEGLEQIAADDQTGRRCLWAAAARTYLHMIRRDLNPANVGQPHFRGADRALANLGRFRAFLAKNGRGAPSGLNKDLADDLAAYLRAEERALAEGRPFASAKAGVITELLARLGSDPAPHAEVLARMASLPAPDPRSLTALMRLAAAGGASKRRCQADGAMLVEVLDSEGAPLATARWELVGPRGEMDPALLARAEQAWRLMDLPEQP